MATFNFTTLSRNFDITGPMVTFTGGTVNATAGDHFSYSSAEGISSYFSGIGFTYSSGNPTSGTVTGLQMYANFFGAPYDFVASGLAVKFSDLNQLTDQSLTNTQQNELYWRTVLSGNDTFNFGSSATANGLTITFAGDASAIQSGETLIAGNDTILGNLGSGFIAGDVVNLTEGATAYAGNDTISAAGGGYIFGDAVYVTGILFAGDDKISVLPGDDSYVAGDAYEVFPSAVVFGGDDIIQVSSGKGAIGDVFDFNGSAFKGGDDTITGGNESNQLTGDVSNVQGGSLQGGSDTIHGGGGSDSIYGDWGTVASGARAVGGDDFLYGDAGNDTMYGNEGNDLLDGGADLDTLYGGAGNDIYVVDNPGDLVDESIGFSNGIDTVQSSVLSIDLTNTTLFKGSIENATLFGSASLNLTGNSLDNVLTGNKAGNVMTGGLGSDTYFVDNSGDKVIEKNEAGVDIVNSSVTFSLAGQYIENLTLTGTSAINATGNSLANTITGNSAANTINGGTGADKMAGGGGNDTYFVDNVGDTVTEANVTGVDNVNSSVTFSLAGQYVEKLTLTGTAAINGTGNSLANTIIGNNASNIIAGGTGKDDLTGGGGKDFFLFNTALNASTNVDIVHAYSVADDTFQLARSVFTGFNGYGTATAGRFWSNTTGLAHDADDRIIYETDSGKLFYDADGTGAIAGVHFATVATGLALTNADFVIV